MFKSQSIFNCSTRKMKQFCVILLFLSVSNSQIAYPEENPVISTQNIDGRQPVYIPGLCPTNQWYWPGNQATDWVCDCAIRYVYHPTTDTCHELYRKGPCQQNEYLVLKKGQIIPECVRNPCDNDTMVPFSGNCHRLYKSDACPLIGKLQGILNVNYTSLELECVVTNPVALNSVSVIDVPTTVPCLPGSKRNALGRCRIIAG